MKVFSRNKYLFNHDLRSDDIENLIISFDSLDFLEYKNIPLEKKYSYVINKIEKIRENKNNIIFNILSNSKVVSLWVISYEDFDSEIFGIDIYRIVYLKITELSPEEQSEIINEALKYLRKIICERRKPAYFLISLNTNASNTSLILTKLLQSGFYFIHTLLTYNTIKDKTNILFTSKNDIVKIREVNKLDVNDVMDLAKKSFKYSRFHLDPFLDNNKANTLLKKSAENSILKGFVDVMYIAEVDNNVVGYYSARKKYIPEFDMTFGDAIISAVDEKYRGKGIFSELNNCLLKWFNIHTDFAEMGTYISNIPVHRTWSKNGLSCIRGTYQLSYMIK